MSSALRTLFVLNLALAAAQPADGQGVEPATSQCDVESLKPSPPLRAAARQDVATAFQRANACVGEKDAACADTALASVAALTLSDDERGLLAIPRADLARLREDAGLAVAIFQEVLALEGLSDPVQREITWRLALLHNTRGEFAQTLRLTASIDCDKWTPETLALRAMAYQELGARELAVQGYETATKLYELEGQAVPSTFKGRYEALLTSEPPEPLPGTEAIALFREPPDYPPNALRRGINGWVVLEFDVTENGATENVRVLRSTNEIFDEVSLATVKRWRQAPNFENGIPVGYTGQQTVVVFCREPCPRSNSPPEQGPDGKYVLPVDAR